MTLTEAMNLESRFQLKLMRRRARLFPRQIGLAAALTAVAIGFLVSAIQGNWAVQPDASQRISAIRP